MNSAAYSRKTSPATEVMILYDSILTLDTMISCRSPTRDLNPQALEPAEKAVGNPVDNGVNNFWG